jgi:hypothetical protein
VGAFWNSRRRLIVTLVSLGLWVAITVVGAIVFASGEIIGLVILIAGAVFTAVRVGVLWLTRRERPTSTSPGATD